MKRISFAWTTASLLAGAKTCTRRAWKDGYAQAFEQGEYVEAWDRLPYRGGKLIGTITLQAKPYLEDLASAPDSDYVTEGLQWMEDRGELIRGVPPREFWDTWRASGEWVYVVRFTWLGPGRYTGQRGMRRQEVPRA